MGSINAKILKAQKTQNQIAIWNVTLSSSQQETEGGRRTDQKNLAFLAEAAQAKAMSQLQSFHSGKQRQWSGNMNFSMIFHRGNKEVASLTVLHCSLLPKKTSKEYAEIEFL